MGCLMLMLGLLFTLENGSNALLLKEGDFYEIFIVGIYFNVG